MVKRIGEALTELGAVSADQVREALGAQKRLGKRLGRIFLELGLINDAQLAAALAKSLGIPLLDCSNLEVSPEALILLPKSLAEKKLLLPIRVKNRLLLLAMADPTDLAAIDEVAFRTGFKVEASVCAESSLAAAIKKHLSANEALYDLLEKLPPMEEVEFVKESDRDYSDETVQSLYRRSEAPPIVKLVNMMILDAAKLRASDLHLEPQEEYTQVRYRVDGDLRNILKYPKAIHPAVTSRIKIISNLNIINRQTPQDGRSAMRMEGRDIDLRVSTLPSIHGENIVIRLLDQRTGLIPLEKLGVPPAVLDPLMRLASQPQGMILVTGPTGSGKTTTLYSLLMALRSETAGIFTIENPIEYHIPGITQVGVNEAVNLTFASALRSILRQDPDIILVGEIRDLETAEIAVRSALTGHLVLSTVHTNSSVATLTRLLDIGLDAYLISSAVTGILAQRLVRRICVECKTEAEAPPAIAQHGFRPLKAYYKGKGCAACQQIGYKGQVGVYELLEMTTPLRRLLSRKASSDDLWECARSGGLVTLFENAWKMVEEGLTTVDEVVLKVPSDPMGMTASGSAYEVPPAPGKRRKPHGVKSAQDYLDGHDPSIKRFS